MYEAVFSRHKKVALQFSGGKDSIAVLFIMRPYWDRLTVYYCDSGNSFPETRALVEEVKTQVPNFCTIKGNQPAIVSEYGYPSDLVPFHSTVFGRVRAGDTGYPMLDRYTCCSASIMVPLHNKMLEDGVTLIIRGQRNDDTQKPPTRSGQVMDGIEFLYPIEKWTEADVFSYLENNNLPIPRFYTHGTSSAHDCMSCTAWLEHGQAGYMKQFYPQEYLKQRRRIKSMVEAISPVLDKMNKVIEESANGLV